MADHRKEARIGVDLPVQAWGIDESGHPFNQYAHVSNISYRGALISRIEKRVRPGDLIAVRYGQRAARFRIIWTRDTGTSEKIRVAVQKLNTEACPWMDLLPLQETRDREDGAVHADLEEGQAAGTGTEANLCRTCQYASVRRWQRYDIDVPVRVIIHRHDKTRVIEGRGTALNEGGMAVVAGTELSIRDEVKLEFTPPYSTGPMRIRVVVRNRKGYRYGVEFLAGSEAEKEERERFRSVLASIASNSLTPNQASPSNESEKSSCRHLEPAQRPN